MQTTMGLEHVNRSHTICVPPANANASNSPQAPSATNAVPLEPVTSFKEELSLLINCLKDTQLYTGENFKKLEAWEKVFNSNHGDLFESDLERVKASIKLCYLLRNILFLPFDQVSTEKQNKIFDLEEDTESILALLMPCGSEVDETVDAYKLFAKERGLLYSGVAKVYAFFQAQRTQLYEAAQECNQKIATHYQSLCNRVKKLINDKRLAYEGALAVIDDLDTKFDAFYNKLSEQEQIIAATFQRLQKHQQRRNVALKRFETIMAGNDPGIQNRIAQITAHEANNNVAASLCAAPNRNRQGEKAPMPVIEIISNQEVVFSHFDAVPIDTNTFQIQSSLPTQGTPVTSQYQLEIQAFVDDIMKLSSGELDRSTVIENLVPRLQGILNQEAVALVAFLEKQKEHASQIFKGFCNQVTALNLNPLLAKRAEQQALILKESKCTHNEIDQTIEKGTALISNHCQENAELKELLKQYKSKATRTISNIEQKMLTGGNDAANYMATHL